MAAIGGPQLARLNTLLGNLATDIAARQTAYFSGLETIREAYTDLDGNAVPAVTRVRNRYWQGRRQPFVLPADGNKLAPDLADKPTDQKESWADFGVTIPATIEASATCDTYVGPGGPGYTLTATITVGGETWSRALGVGPEAAARTYNWTKQVVTP